MVRLHGEFDVRRNLVAQRILRRSTEFSAGPDVGRWPSLQAMSQIGDTGVAKAVFHSRALAEIRALPRPLRKRIGSAIWDLQLGRRLGMPLSRPMPDVASGVCELRLHDENAQYRVLYCIRPGRGVLILSAFAKSTRRIPVRELRLARHRLRDLLSEEG